MSIANPLFNGLKRSFVTVIIPADFNASTCQQYRHALLELFFSPYSNLESIVANCALSINPVGLKSGAGVPSHFNHIRPSWHDVIAYHDVSLLTFAISENTHVAFVFGFFPRILRAKLLIIFAASPLVR